MWNLVCTDPNIYYGLAVESHVLTKISIKIVQVLRWFVKDSEEMVDEEILRDLSELRVIFDTGKDGPVYTCFTVNKEQAKRLQKIVSTEIDIEKYDYFVGADAGYKVVQRLMKREAEVIDRTK